MGNFWEKSPEWQRKQELAAEFDAAKEAMDEAGKSVLILVRIDADMPRGQEWRNRRQAYLDAVDTYEAAAAAWREAKDAFEASPAGQARDRYLADPLTFRAAEAAESEAA